MYVIPYFSAYQESEVRKLFPAEPKAVFRASLSRFPGPGGTVPGSGVVAGSLTGIVLLALFPAFHGGSGRASSSA